MQVDLAEPDGGPMAALFAEELGLVLEVSSENEAEVLSVYAEAGVPCTCIGSSTAEKTVEVTVNGKPAVKGEAIEGCQT